VSRAYLGRFDARLAAHLRTIVSGRPSDATRRPHHQLSDQGRVPDALVTVVATKWFGSGALELTYKEPAGKLASEILFRDREPTLEVVTVGRPWSFDGDGAQFRLVSEARRIRLAHLFDRCWPYIRPLSTLCPPDYGCVRAMLPRQPLRFLLADDPGAGKTIMAGLYIKELIARGTCNAA